MNFFRKATPKETKPIIKEEVAPEPFQMRDDLSPEENAQRWFSERFGTDMPDEVRQMFRKMAQTEAKRQKVGKHMLDTNELKRLEEAIRLQQTKLTNVNQTLSGLQAQKEWLHKFKELKSLLEKYKQTYFEKNKKYNERLQDIKELERFETFEEIQNNYQRIKAKEETLHHVRTERSKSAQTATELEETHKQLQEEAELDSKKYKEIRSRLPHIQNALAEGYRLQAHIQHYEIERNELTQYKESIDRDVESLKTECHNADEELKRNAEQISALQQQAQGLESQQWMLEKGEVILAKLNFLQTLTSRKANIQTALEQTQRQQHEQNEKLNHLFLISQDIDAQISTLQDELKIHQKSILGQSSYNLQQRAIDLKSKREMLVNATHLWQQITEGYARVDSQGQEIMRMKHHSEAVKNQISQLEIEVEGLDKQVEELKYAYTLSKSQDVMYLRQDLHEGASCSVCGATHHPFHSDTLLEQSKLIGEMKQEYEQTETELRHKKATLLELLQEYANESGKIESAFESLEVYKKTLQDNIAHWENFVSLDLSFKDCSSSSNFEARRIMLQQLMEKTTLDAEQAKEELDLYSFHQNNINNINEKLSQKKQEKNEITTQINEVNTACQVLAFRIEQLQQSIARNTKNIQQLYEDLDSMIVIAGWYNEWTENPETLNIYLRQQTAKWSELKRSITDKNTEKVRLETLLTTLNDNLTHMKKIQEVITERIGQTSEQKEHANELLQKGFDNGDVERYSKDILKQLDFLETQYEESDAKAQEAGLKATTQRGYVSSQDDVLHALEEKIAEERSQLDFWIKKYNSTNSPVQFAELERTFNAPTDWNELRRIVRSVTVDNLVAEARAEEARLALAAHQINALSQGNDTIDRTAALNVEIAKMERERSNILVELAKLQAQIDEHELSKQQLAIEHEGFNIP